MLVGLFLIVLYFLAKCAVVQCILVNSMYAHVLCVAYILNNICLHCNVRVIAYNYKYMRTEFTIN